MTHDHIPQVIFDWLEHRHFSVLTNEEREQVLLYFSEEEYNELHNTSFFIQKSMEAGSTSRHIPVKKDLLKTFDNAFTTSQPRLPLLQVFWQIAAVFLLFAAGWICHYLSGYRPHDGEMMATADTAYIVQKNLDMDIFDTASMNTDHADHASSKPLQGYDKMREKRDATEYIPVHTNTLPPHNREPEPVNEFHNKGYDSLLKYKNS